MKGQLSTTLEVGSLVHFASPFPSRRFQKRHPTVNSLATLQGGILELYPSNLRAWEFRSHGQFVCVQKLLILLAARVGFESATVGLSGDVSDWEFESKIANDDFVMSYG